MSAKEQAEIDKLGAEKNKLQSEKSKLDAEVKTIELSRGFERIRALSTLGTIIAAGVTLISIGMNSCQYIETQKKDVRQRTEQQITSLIEQMSAPEGSRRASAALGLGVFIGSKSIEGTAKTEESILDVLTYALGRESDPFVRDAIVASIGKSAKNIDPALQRLVGRLVNDIAPQFDKEYALRSGISQMPEGDARSELERQHVQVRDQIFSMQSALVEIATLLSERRKKRGASKESGIDLRKLPLKGFSFVGTVFDLRGANFSDTSLWNVDFYGVDLTGANFSGAWISGTNFTRATLIRANFRGAQSINTAIDGEKLESTRFDYADLKDAVFDEGCICHADFTTAVNVLAVQFTHSNTTGSVLPTPLLIEVEAYELANRDKYCVGTGQ